jgi:hypothetical protein
LTDFVRAQASYESTIQCEERVIRGEFNNPPRPRVDPKHFGRCGSLDERRDRPSVEPQRLRVERNYVDRSRRARNETVINDLDWTGGESLLDHFADQAL